MTKSCSECVFHTTKNISDTYAVSICDYPVPAWIQIRVSGGNFLSGIEAETCPLYKSKVDMINEVKL